ncbi:MULTISPECIES: iron dependent repressor, metal binding and dimerization domain protein [Paenarthrobacter]|jgi:DtxR family Mn-dependent transcriptional regulator|uniref:DtxR family Mn-dependent transcriptional regulator n=1 Tax=Paenarthrobacter nicotinovorans TaxID=29320 RepID=A0ABT9TNF9_PAENI|nr:MULTISPECIES: iron dependent repressor, metal binding and dimerization domain protein [Paenarthrobacter]KIA74303.1 iron-dependent repressor [Arthrobacter sp. MWB30]KQR04060.1 dihydrofolate reductase [Arthrobacter sp. Leaf145]SKB54484.1 iron (metal) dependent repressor, DtxR family [Arthrobacter sp. 31Cvi3.1E]BCW09654.1 DtxR family transcriptional regulator [Arthrobacter sp. NtRootA2]BCW13734.1 DtxR family transcriptional regulator [Arthrobacter sp. NtRootA4]BCW22070.1 DtxR family transcrip
MTDLIDTTEMYLRTILELEEENIVALRARIAERLRHSGPTVSQTIGRMERDGLVIVSNDRHLELTEVGRKRATEVMRKHRLAERLLADVIGLDWAYVHDEACRWEHVMSERVERRLYELLEHPTESPYGNPIPGLEALGGMAGTQFPRIDVNLLQAMDGYASDSRVVVTRLAEPIQVEPELLTQLDEGGIRPGAPVSLERVGEYISVRVPGIEGALELPPEVAAHVFVSLN